MQQRILLTLILLSTLVQAAEFRTFTDSQGREMQAKITRVSGDEVYIERRDGLGTRVKISLFSSNDQDYIRDWEQQNFLKSGVVGVRFTEETAKEQKKNQGGLQYTLYEGGYEVILNNTGDKDVPEVRVDYLMFLFRDKIGAKKRSDGTIERQKGSIELRTLKARSESRLPTKTFEMKETELAPGYVWSLQEAGHEPDSEDSLEGIWVKVYSGDTLILESSRPESLMHKEPW